MFPCPDNVISHHSCLTGSALLSYGSAMAQLWLSYGSAMAQLWLSYWLSYASIRVLLNVSIYEPLVYPVLCLFTMMHVDRMFIK